MPLRAANLGRPKSRTGILGSLASAPHRVVARNRDHGRGTVRLQRRHGRIRAPLVRSAYDRCLRRPGRGHRLSVALGVANGATTRRSSKRSGAWAICRIMSGLRCVWNCWSNSSRPCPSWRVRGHWWHEDDLLQAAFLQVPQAHRSIWPSSRRIDHRAFGRLYEQIACLIPTHLFIGAYKNALL